MAYSHSSCIRLRSSDQRAHVKGTAPSNSNQDESYVNQSMFGTNNDDDSIVIKAHDLSAAVDNVAEHVNENVCLTVTC
jgi:hypothetical protein